MKDLVAKLPRADQRYRDPNVGDSTIGAVLGILFETVKHSADFTRFLTFSFLFLHNERSLCSLYNNIT